ncbi:MAG: hypothetical protein DHS20C16_00960 [Phycisphaerae bacterium]|nr:MAG: hypothetical protein DHS20C16_00960 [Phycisphaerae bacterium]
MNKNDIRTLAFAGLFFLQLPSCSSSNLSLKPRMENLPQDVVVLPTRSCGDLFFVTARINGEDGFNLILDTGASGLSLSREAARRLWRNGSTRHVNELRIGDYVVRDFDATTSNQTATSAMLGERIDGLLGVNLFAGVLLTIDFPNRMIKLERGSLDASSENVTRYTGGERPFLKFQTAGVRQEFLLDTGFTGAIGVPSLEKMQLDGDPVFHSVSASVRGGFLTQAARLSTDATWGPLRLSRPIVRTRKKRTPIIGTDILSRFALTFDHAKKLVRFDGPIHQAIGMEPLRSMGFIVSPEKGKYRVVHVIENSPTHEAGIELGDHVEAIDGNSLRIDCESRNNARRERSTLSHRTVTFSREGRQWDAVLRYVEQLP